MFFVKNRCSAGNSYQRLMVSVFPCSHAQLVVRAKCNIFPFRTAAVLKQNNVLLIKICITN